MPACAFCGVNMTVAEVTARPYDGVVGNYHRDCAYMEYLYNSGPVSASPTLTSEVGGTWRFKLRHARMKQAEVAGIAAPALATAAGAVLGVGAYKYAVTFVDDLTGESAPGTLGNITTTGGNTNVSVTAIPLGPNPLTLKRKLYRTVVGGAQLKLLTTLNDNTTTTFTDNVADGSLGANAPAATNFAKTDFP